MLSVTTILDKLEEAASWEDGEELTAIRARLTLDQLTAPGRLILRISERGTLPWLFRARIEQHGTLLCEVAQRLPADLTHAKIQAVIEGWQALGYSVNVTPDEPKRQS